MIGDRPLEELVPLYRDTDNKESLPATQFNMKWVETAGLVKFDFLGLKTLTVIEKACGLIGHDKIKIDKGFIRDISVQGSRNPAIITAIVSLAKALDMDTTAEGIEARDELNQMRKLGVDQIQGYIYSPARPFDEVSQALTSGDWVIEPAGPDKQRAERRTVLRKVGAIHDDHRYEVTMRNLSRTGAGIEGLIDVPLGTQFVIDLGDGQLAVSIVRRSEGYAQGLEFETPLVDDGAGGLCTRHRVAPYVLAAMGMPHGSTGGAVVALNNISHMSMPKFGTVDTTKSNRAA